MKNNFPDILKWPAGKLDFSAHRKVSQTGGSLLMGILNVTPDSFSDGGKFLDREKAIEQGLKMAEHGAAIIDVGPESTRPGSEPVPAKEQIQRAIPVIEKLIKKTKICISIDTTNYQVAKAALDAGSGMINDITALANEKMAKLAAEHQVPVVLMHIQGTPRTMQVEPKYKDVVAEVLAFLLERAKRAQTAGIPKERIFIDPGIGFGKTVEHNLKLLANLDKFIETGYRVLVGPSRKAFIGKITGKSNPDERIFGTAAAVALCAAAGVSILRVHDVAEMTDIVKIVNEIRNVKE
jgi:dihydropteroate synthase